MDKTILYSGRLETASWTIDKQGVLTIGTQEKESIALGEEIEDP